MPSYCSGEIENVSDGEFEALLGRPIPDGHWSGTIGMNDAICQLYYAKSLKARLAYKIMTALLNRSMRKGEPDLNIIFVYNMPFRGIGKMTGGMVSQEMCEGILTIVNGHAIAFFQGLGKIISGYLKQRKALKKARSME
jgi:beta-glucosidase